MSSSLSICCLSITEWGFTLASSLFGEVAGAAHVTSVLWPLLLQVSSIRTSMVHAPSLLLAIGYRTY